MAGSTSENYTISIPAPSYHVDLAALDALHPIHYSRRLLLFRCASAQQRDEQLKVLKVGAQALVSRCPILGGVVVPASTDDDLGEDWRTIFPGLGMDLLVKDLRAALPSFEELQRTGFSADKLPYKLLVPVPADIGNDQPFAACMIQFSAIEGGTILTWAMSHSVADGSGNNELMRVLAEATCRAPELPVGGTGSVIEEHSTPDMGLDRSILRDMTSDIPFRIEDHPGYMTNPPAQPPLHPFQATDPEIPISIHIRVSRLAHLKADAQQPGAPPISTHDALCALMWRSIILIRSRRSPESLDLPPNKPVNLFMPSDARRHLNIPESYIGNAVYQLNSSLDLRTILSRSGLQAAASAIRRTITAVTPEKVRSVLAQTNKQWVDWAFLGSYNSTGVAMGTDWTSSGLYEHDWGKAFRPMVRFRYPGEEGLNCIYPKLPDGSAEVVVAVMADEVDLLLGEECFGKYIRG